VAGGQILAFPIDFDRRPYNTLALPCECVMHVWYLKKSLAGRVQSIKEKKSSLVWKQNVVEIN